MRELAMLGDRALYLLFGGLAVLLAIASAVGWVLARRAATPQSVDTVRNLVDRINAWWVMVAVLAADGHPPLGHVGDQGLGPHRALGRALDLRHQDRGPRA